jgi:hypothetical protein
VGGFERFGNLSGDVESFLDGDGTGGDGLFQGRAGDELHHQSTFLDAVDDGDVGVVERRQHLRLASEAGEIIRVVGQREWQYLDCDFAVELRISSAPHLAHSAFAELGGDAVVSNGGSWAHHA